MAKKKILILGAGLSGLSVAWHLKKRKIDCQVFEKEPEVGGLCRSKRINGFTFDYDGHLLHFKQQYTFAFVKDLLKDNLAEHKRSAWVYSFDRFTRYPFQVNLHGLPPKVAKECLSAFVKAQNNGLAKKNGNFLSWIQSSFGTGIARHFMVPYNTKFWTVPPHELTCDWLDGIIPVPTLSQLIEGTIEESRRQFGYNARFWYPQKGGINQLPLALAERLKNIHTDCRAQGISLARKEVTFTSGRKERFDVLISTIPLPELPHLIEEVPENINSEFRKLRWNSIFNLNLGIEKKDDSSWHWVYFPQKECSFFRVGFPHHFSADLTPENKSSLYAEVSYSSRRPIDKKQIVLVIKRDLKKAGILAENDRICAQDFNDIRFGYPIYDKNYASARKKILDFLSLNNFISCGRYGRWRYMSMEDVILEGKEIAERFSY
jgi:protoporphyrinogen oxidase